MKSKNISLGEEWQDVRSQIFSEEEIAESDLRVSIIKKLIEARTEKGISQKTLESMSGVKQPIIARMEKGVTDPRLGTVLKVLAPLGLTLTVVPIKKI